MRNGAYILLLSALLVGCGEEAGVVGSTPPRPSAVVDNILCEITPPVVQNFDNKPGPDGLQVRLMFFRNGQDLPVTVSGPVEIQIFEDRSQSATASSRAQSVPATPFHTWKFESGQINRYLRKTLYGWVYVVPLQWGQHVPQSDKIAIRAIYKLSDQRTIASSATMIPMGLR